MSKTLVGRSDTGSTGHMHLCEAVAINQVGWPSVGLWDVTIVGR